MIIILSQKNNIQICEGSGIYPKKNESITAIWKSIDGKHRAVARTSLFYSRENNKFVVKQRHLNHEFRANSAIRREICE